MKQVFLDDVELSPSSAAAEATGHSLATNDWKEHLRQSKMATHQTAFKRCSRMLRCRAGPDTSPLDQLYSSSPLWANRIFDLDLADDQQNWRREANGVADSIRLARKYKAEGARMKVIGDVMMLITSLCSALIPVLIGLQGSLGDEPDEIQANDRKLKYTAIALSIVNTVVTTFQGVSAFRQRGIAKRSAADNMKQTIADYFAQSGIFYEAKVLPGDKLHSGQAYRAFRNEFNALAKKARDIDGSQNDVFQVDHSGGQQQKQKQLAQGGEPEEDDEQPEEATKGKHANV